MKHKPGTRVVHAGQPAPEAGAPFLPGPVFAAPYHLPGDAHQTEFGYGRESNPTWVAYESAVAELDEATSATLFARSATGGSDGGGRGRVCPECVDR